MWEKNHFTVRNQKLVLNLCLLVIGIMVLMMVLFTIFTKPPHFLMYIVISLFFILPASVAAMWSGLYKVTVDGSSITVRRAMGFQYNLDVSEIKRVNWRKNMVRKSAWEGPSGEPQVGLEVIRIYTSSGKRFSAETLMYGFEEMSQYILENVDSSKIHYI